MRLDDLRQSGNIEDRRGGRGILAVGGGVGTLVLILLGLFFGVDPSALLNDPAVIDEVGAPGASETSSDPTERERERVVSIILASTEDVWSDIFSRMGKHYSEPKLVLFRNRVQSACGFSSAAVGPFYCPGDERVYIDLVFFDELEHRFGAPGDFAQAYVVAHEVGHHVQNLLGISDRFHSMRRGMNEAEGNALSVRLELQADFFAGLWAHHAHKTRNILEPGDMEEGLRAASAIGDDRLQVQARGYVVPDAFTHGTAAQRLRWFRKGMETGDFRQGDTFKAQQL